VNKLDFGVSVIIHDGNSQVCFHKLMIKAKGRLGGLTWYGNRLDFKMPMSGLELGDII
jgi:hypothetical protein